MYLVAAATNNKQTPVQSKYEKLVKEYETKIKKGADDYKNYIGCGEAYYNWAIEQNGSTELLDKAESYFTAVINSPKVSDKAKAAAYEWRAKVYDAQRYKSGMAEKAKKDFLQAGYKYKEAKEYTEATTAVFKALAIDRDSGEAWNLMGDIESSQEHYDIAVGKYETAIGCQNYNLYTIYANRGWAKYNWSKKVDDLKRQELLNSALEDFNESLDKKLTHELAHEGRFLTYFELGNYEKARVDFNILSDQTQKKYQTEKRILDNPIPPDPDDHIEQLSMQLHDLDSLFKTFLISLAINFVLALAYKFKTHNLTVVSAIQEFLLIIIFLVIIMALNEVDEKQLVPINNLNEIILIVFLVYTLLSILQNAGHLGVPIPDWLTNLLQNIIDAIRRFFRI